MKLAIVTTMVTAALVAACSDAEAPAGNGTASAAPVAAPAPAAPGLSTGEEGVRRYAECAHTLNALANLYSAIASSSTGAEQERMLQAASSESLAALEFERRATELTSGVPNLPPGHVQSLMDGRRDRLQEEQDRQPFEDFAVWLAREADQCATIAPPGA